MQRKLATIQRVKTVEPVITRDGVPADSLELATFEDIAWQVVVKKGQFKPGDKAIYIEISTVTPDHPAFEFLRKKGFKVKTQKFVGTTLSQGLAMPVDLLCEFNPIMLEIEELEADLIVGSEVTELLGIVRYDPEVYDVKMSGDVLGKFPEHIVPKTDQERIQSMPFLLTALNALQGKKVATLKIDGMSGTFYFDDGVLHACSRNFEQKPDNGSVWWTVAEKFHLAEVLQKYPHLVIQGEVAGPGIQKNRLGLDGVYLIVFDIWDRNANNYFSFDALLDFCVANGLIPAPIVHSWEEEQYTIPELLEMAKGFYFNTKNHREGLVIRPYDRVVFDPRLGRQLTFKVINNDYLLKDGE